MNTCADCARTHVLIQCVRQYIFPTPRATMWVQDRDNPQAGERCNPPELGVQGNLAKTLIAIGSKKKCIR
jgi:hypothetical protein